MQNQNQRNKRGAMRLSLRTGVTVADFIAMAAIGAIFLWYVIFLSVGDAGRLLGYLNAGGLWWGCVVLAAAIVLICRRHWLLALPGLVLAAFIFSAGLALPFHKISVPSDAPRFRLITASLRTSNADMEDAAAMLTTYNPDIIVVQEAHGNELLQALFRKTGDHWNSAQLRNEIIACRCPVRSTSASNAILSASVMLPSGPVNIWNIHAPKSYAKAALNSVFFDNLADAMVKKNGGVVAGDFNATPWNDGYRIISAIAQDAWQASGWGPGLTFPGPSRRSGRLIPFIRIDHVFSMPDLIPVYAEIGHASHGADHFPVIVDFARAKG
jgi:endonuclease/exonuclease/phosphatase (EEP) superfamily protein YafD